MPRDFEEDSDAFDEENYDDINTDSSFLSDFSDEIEDEDVGEDEAEDIEQLYDHMIKNEAVISLLIKKGIITNEEIEKEKNKIESNWK